MCVKPNRVSDIGHFLNWFYVVNQLFIVLAWMLHSENADIT